MVSDLLIVLGLIVVNGLFSGAEIAVLTARKGRIRELAAAGRGGARAVNRLREAPEQFLATVQIGITIVAATSAAYGGELIAPRLAESLGWLGPYARQGAFVLVVAGFSFLSLVIGELVPKSLALRRADGYAMLVGRPLLWLAQLMRPLVWFLTGASNAVLRIFGDRTSFAEARLSREELREMVEEAAKSGTVDARASEIAARALELGEVTVRSLMVPQLAMTALPRRAAPDEVRRTLLESGHSRMPIYEETPDKIVGYVIAKDVFALVWGQGLVIMDDILRPVHFVPETARAIDVLRDLQKRHIQLAIVCDENGTVTGLVTVEDLVEELVGEIFSEDEAERIRNEPDGAALVDGTVPVREVNRVLGLSLPEGTWTTIAGLVLAQSAWLPVLGARYLLPDGTELEVVETSGRRVARVRVRPQKVPRPEER